LFIKQHEDLASSH